MGACEPKLEFADAGGPHGIVAGIGGGPKPGGGAGNEPKGFAGPDTAGIHGFTADENIGSCTKGPVGKAGP
jgi:hypothetical protein